MSDDKNVWSKKHPLHCNFCGKDQNEVKRLIAGPMVYICDECVELCVDIIREDAPSFALKSHCFDPRKVVFILDGHPVGGIKSAAIHINANSKHILTDMHPLKGGTLTAYLTSKKDHKFYLTSQSPTEEKEECPTSTSISPDGSSPSSSALSPEQDGAQ